MKYVKKIFGSLISSMGMILTGIVLLIVLNPMGLAFITGFVIRNESTRTLYVTPVGVLGDERRILPQVLLRIPYIPIMDRQNIKLRKGQSIKIYYDWDDVTFSEIAVRDEKNTWRQMSVLPEEEKVCCSPNKKGVYVLPVFDELEEISPQVKKVISREDAVNGSGWLLSVILLLLGPVSIYLGRMLAR